jgi:methionyl-tRNA formyltransferase
VTLRLAFAGTPAFAVPALEALHAAGHDLVGVWTQPDRPAGRGRQLAASPVKDRALALGLAVHQPESFKDPAAVEALRAAAPDAFVVVAYGLILPRAVLAVPRLGCFNIHASLLPRWRGAAPIQRALLAGDAETGVCIMRMEAGLDTGPVLTRVATPIGAHETAGELHDRLAALGATACVAALADLAAGRAQETVQDHAAATYAHKLDKAEARLDWTRSAAELDRQVRAFDPWPIAETRWQGRTLRVWRAAPCAAPGRASAGTVVQAGRDGIVVNCGADALAITRAQLPGGKVLDAAQLTAGHDFAGAVFG